MVSIYHLVEYELRSVVVGSDGVHNPWVRLESPAPWPPCHIDFLTRRVFTFRVWKCKHVFLQMRCPLIPLIRRCLDIVSEKNIMLTSAIVRSSRSFERDF